MVRIPSSWFQRLAALLLVLLASSVGCDASDLAEDGNCTAAKCDEADEEAQNLGAQVCTRSFGFWDCESMAEGANLCDFGDETIRINGGDRLRVSTTPGAGCMLNATARCHRILLAEDGSHLACMVGAQRTRIGLDGVPSEDQGIDACRSYGDGWEYTGFIRDEPFVIESNSTGLACRLRGTAIEMPREDEDEWCRSLVLGQVGFTCGGLLWPFSVGPDGSA